LRNTQIIFMAKAGRPKKPKHEVKVPGISIRFTPAERKAIDAAVKRSGLSQTDFCKKILLNASHSDIGIT
jgi:hypothetical protein